MGISRHRALLQGILYIRVSMQTVLNVGTCLMQSRRDVGRVGGTDEVVRSEGGELVRRLWHRGQTGPALPPSRVKKPQVSEAQLGVWRGMSPASACGLIRGSFLLLGGVEGDACLCPHVFWGALGEGLSASWLF